MERYIVLLIAAAINFATSQGNASTVNGTLDAVITKVTIDDVNVSVGGIDVDDQVQVLFDYDSSATDSAPDPDFGLYLDIIGTISASIDGQLFSGELSDAEVRNDDAGFDVLILRTPIDTFPVGWTPLGASGQRVMTLALADSTGTLYSGDSLPTSFAISDYDVRFFSMDFLVGVTFPGGSSPDEVLIESTTVVPEPSTLMLLVVGGMCVLVHSLPTVLGHNLFAFSK